LVSSLCFGLFGLETPSRFTDGTTLSDWFGDLPTNSCFFVPQCGRAAWPASRDWSIGQLPAASREAALAAIVVERGSDAALRAGPATRVAVRATTRHG
jgi:hypothetical protein